MVQDFQNLLLGIVRTSVSQLTLLLKKIRVISFKPLLSQRAMSMFRFLEIQTWRTGETNQSSLDTEDLQFFTRLCPDCQREQECSLPSKCPNNQIVIQKCCSHWDGD